MDWIVPAAFVLDLLLGDPRWLPHPIVLIGLLIRRLEMLVVTLFDSRKIAGVFLAATTLAVSGLSAYLAISLADIFHPVLGMAASVWVGFTTLALHSLHKESRNVVRWLEEGNIDEARRALSLIVGRQTHSLDEEGILKACIETVSENTSDAVVAPLFYLFLGGPVLAVIFKAASTLDSMVGYKTDRYRELGWASARLDDLLNLIPARLTGLLMVLAALPLRLSPRRALKIMLRDARKPSSPNAGWPEAATAGALGVQLGGPAVYFGEKVDKPTLGDPDVPVTIDSYRAAVRLMYGSSLLALAGGMAATALVG